MSTVRDVMTTNPTTVEPDTTLDRIAALMRDEDTGFVPVISGDRLHGAVTDRDIVIRAIAEGRAPRDCSAEDVETTGLVTLAPDDDLKDAAARMRDAKVRRIAVVEDERLVGVVAIGDLAIELDEDSALADISAGRPNG